MVRKDDCMMKQKTLKKFIGIFVATTMLLQCFAITTFAQEATSEVQTEVQTEAVQKRELIPTLSGKTAKIFLIGDSTCEDLPQSWYPREGWGMEFGKFLKKNVKVINMSKGGKSTRSFLQNWDAPSNKYDTRMDDIKKQASKGDWLFINLGHNDYGNTRPGVPTDATKPDDNGDFTSYRKNLERFIEFADERNLNIAFLTSINTLTSFSDGKLNRDGIQGHRNAMREVAEKHGIPLIDVSEQHKLLMEDLGDKHVKEIFMFASRDEYPNLPPDVSVGDTTHINYKGAQEVSKIIVNEIKKGAEAGDERFRALYELVDTKVDTTPLHYEDEPEEEVSIDSSVSLVPGKNNAYVVFGKTIQTNHMKYLDGFDKGVTDPSDPIYSEKVTLDGVDARKMYASNKAFLNLDKTYYQPGDSRFLVMITYYDFGPDVGYFYFDYNSNDEALGEEQRASKRITITKPGIVPKWTTVRLYIDDADFSGKQANGADMSLVTRTYNAWAMIEIVNIDAMERDNSTENVPVVNAVQQSGIEKLGLYKSKDENGKSFALEDKLTKIQALEATLIALGYERELKNAAPTKNFTDLNEYQAKVVGLGEKLGIVSQAADKKFNPNAFETVNGGLTYFLKYLKIPSENNYQDAYDLAKKSALILNTDFVIFKDNPLIRDNFVAMAYNAIMIENHETHRAPVGEMLDKGLFTGKDLKNTGLPSLAAFEYYNPVSLPATKIVDAGTGRTYYYMNFDGRMALKPYVSSYNWNKAGTKFLFGCRVTNAMYEYDIKNQMVRIVDLADCDGVHLHVQVIAENDMVYYGKNGQTWVYNWNTGEKKKLADRSFSIMSVTNDGKYASGDATAPDGQAAAGRLNLETGELETMSVNKQLKESNPMSGGQNHAQINPVYPELQFFAHEGTTEYIPDRIWLGNWDTGEMRNMVIQGKTKTGEQGENFGHEVWSADGEYMYFVKYNGSKKGQSGFVRTDRYGNNREYINGDYPYWHCSPSGDNNWIAGDTSGGQMIVASTNTYQSYLLCTFRMYSWTHPYQPHPCLSYYGNSVNWQMVDDDNKLGIGWMEIGDITGQKIEKEILEINDEVSAIIYEGTNCYAKKGTHLGEECIIVPKKTKLCLDLNDEIINSQNGSVDLEITYYDFGMLPIVVSSSSAIVDTYDVGNFNDTVQKINKTAKNDWKTITVSLDNANLANAGEHKSDLYLSSMFSQIIIKDIKIIVKDN